MYIIFDRMKATNGIPTLVDYHKSDIGLIMCVKTVINRAQNTN